MAVPGVKSVQEMWITKVWIATMVKHAVGRILKSCPQIHTGGDKSMKTLIFSVTITVKKAIV
jgi:hypothetical protein